MKALALLLSIFLFSSMRGCLAQVKPDYVTIEKLEEIHQNTPRPVVILLYTEWCRYCQLMEHVTLKNKEVVQLLNTYFYTVRFNAESKDPFIFQNKTYKYTPTGLGTGVHGFAPYIGEKEGRLVYPTTIFLSKDLNVMYKHTEYLSSSELLVLLKEILRS